MAVLFPATRTLLHNPRCSKSRAAQALLAARGIAVHERRYLDEPLSPAELRELARRLGGPVAAWVRRGEPAYREAGLGPRATDDELLAAMARFPILIERPIFVTRDAAVIGRPPERVLALID